MKPEEKAPEWDLQEAKHIVTSMLQDYPAKIYLFGSRATGKANCYSDWHYIAVFRQS